MHGWQGRRRQRIIERWASTLAALALRWRSELDIVGARFGRVLAAADRKAAYAEPCKREKSHEKEPSEEPCPVHPPRPYVSHASRGRASAPLARLLVLPTAARKVGEAIGKDDAEGDEGR